MHWNLQRVFIRKVLRYKFNIILLVINLFVHFKWYDIRIRVSKHVFEYIYTRKDTLREVTSVRTGAKVHMIKSNWFGAPFGITFVGTLDFSWTPSTARYEWPAGDCEMSRRITVWYIAQHWRRASKHPL